MPIDILLVEDNEGDIRLMRKVLDEIKPTAGLHVVTGGVEAMEFLGYQGRQLDAPRPDVILLDLDPPKMHGHETLTGIQANPHLRRFPVIVLTSSEVESDVVSSHQLRANSYLRKPDALCEFEALVRSLNHFWLARVGLPA
jgi:chemotaxis family two-component system response regulator Rcp1